MTISIARLHELPPDFAALRAQATAEGFAFLNRLNEHWRGGAYGGDSGAGLFAAFDDAALVAIGAHTPDYYDPSPTHRRIRHFYVAPRARCQGVGRALANAIMQDALAQAPRLHLRAAHDASTAFWDAMGFSRVARADRTHEKCRP